MRPSGPGRAPLNQAPEVIGPDTVREQTKPLITTAFVVIFPAAGSAMRPLVTGALSKRPRRMSPSVRTRPSHSGKTGISRDVSVEQTTSSEWPFIDSAIVSNPSSNIPYPTPLLSKYDVP